MTRRFALLALLFSLVLAGGASYYASAHPDGLERVAIEAGFIDRAEESPAEGSPLAGYRTEGVEDSRLSGGLAGVVGVLVVLVLAAGLARVVRRRPSEQTTTESTAGTPVDSDGRR